MARDASTYRAARRNAFRRVWDSIAKLRNARVAHPERTKGAYGRHIIFSESMRYGSRELHATKGWRSYRAPLPGRSVAWWLPA